MEVEKEDWKSKTYEIRSTDSDVDDVGDGLSGVPLPVSGDQLFAELLHVGQHGVHLRGHVLAIDDDRRVRTILQKMVEKLKIKNKEETSRWFRNHNLIQFKEIPEKPICNLQFKLW